MCKVRGCPGLSGNVCDGLNGKHNDNHRMGKEGDNNGVLHIIMMIKNIENSNNNDKSMLLRENVWCCGWNIGRY